MSTLPAGFHSQMFTCNGISLHAVLNFDPEADSTDIRPIILFLHGFPEFWIAWRDVFVRLADTFRVIAPDQRGFNLSDAPQGRAPYKTGLMVADLADLIEQVGGSTKVVVAGHDWGASVAYAFSMSRPDLVSHLVIANGVHPVCFQNALTDFPEQAAASQYFHILTREDAPERMSADHFEKLLGMFERFSHSPWLSEDLKEEYRTAWAQPGRLQTMLHWYASSPIVVPSDADDGKDAPLYRATSKRFNVTMPHLVIWGMKDQALLPVCRDGLDGFCHDLTLHELEEGDHWLLHSHAYAVAERMMQFFHAKGLV